MAQVSRRSFLRNSGLAVAGAGVMSQIPLLSGLVGATEADAPAAVDSSTAATEEGAASLSEPLVAHVRDLSTGEIGIFNGTREVILNDPQLAARLFRAAR
ncbi:MAG TPA: twin-arginine translocation signal domain-containing protein [Acidimicrobiales bacterium]|nr:twin-arginine translocation signal domain-containing protein [Acidimicrobiales bacterium]